jgi:hypothetical protein
METSKLQPTANAGQRFGGELSEYPKPWRLLFGEAWSEPREIKVYSHVWPVFGVSLGANGHHHVDIREEDNLIWVEENGKGIWGRPWKWDEDKEMRAALKGRWDFNSDLISKREVVKWAVGVLREWGVLRNKNYKIVWDLDEDDPDAVAETATDAMRRRLERSAGIAPSPLKTPKGL